MNIFLWSFAAWVKIVLASQGVFAVLVVATHFSQSEALHQFASYAMGAHVLLFLLMVVSGFNQISTRHQAIWADRRYFWLCTRFSALPS